MTSSSSSLFSISILTTGSISSVNRSSISSEVERNIMSPAADAMINILASNDGHQEDILVLRLQFKWQCIDEYENCQHLHCRMDQQRVSMFIPRVALVNSSSNSSNQSSSQSRRHRSKSDWSEESCESDGFYAEKNRIAGPKTRAHRKKEIYYIHKGPKRTKGGSTHTTGSSSTSSLSSSDRSSYVSRPELNWIKLSLTLSVIFEWGIPWIFHCITPRRASTRCCWASKTWRISIERMQQRPESRIECSPTRLCSIRTVIESSRWWRTSRVFWPLRIWRWQQRRRQPHRRRMA